MYENVFFFFFCFPNIIDYVYVRDFHLHYKTHLHVVENTFTITASRKKENSDFKNRRKTHLLLGVMRNEI